MLINYNITFQQIEDKEGPWYSTIPISETE